MHGRTNSGNHVFALSVDQVVAVKNFLAGAWVAREANARSGVLASVPEDHLHDVDGGAKQPGDFFHAPIGHSLLRHPRAEHRSDGSPQLFHGVVRKILPGLLLEKRLVFRNEFFPSAGWNGSVFLDAQLLFHRAQPMLKIFLGHFHHNRRIHLHKAAVCVIRKPFILRDGRKPCNGAVGQAQVKNGFHHAGHRTRRTRAHTNEKRILRITQLFPGYLLQPRHVRRDLFFQFRRILLPVFVKVIARFRRNRESRRNRQANLRHLGKTSALAAEQVAPRAVTFCFTCTKKIDPFFHCSPRLGLIALICYVKLCGSPTALPRNSATLF